MENLTKEQRENRQTAMQTINNASVQAQSVFDAFKPENIVDAYTAQKALVMLASVNEKTDLVKCKICEKVKKEKMYNQMLNEKKREYYKTFGEWAENECGIKRSQANAYVMVAKVVDENGHDTLRKENELRNDLPFSFLKELMYGIKVDIEDEEKAYEEKAKIAKNLLIDNIINVNMSIAELKEKLRSIYPPAKRGQDKKKDESTAENVDESTAENVDESTAENVDESTAESKAESLNEKAEKLCNNLEKVFTAMYGKKLPQTLTNYLKGIKEYATKAE